MCAEITIWTFRGLLIFWKVINLHILCLKWLADDKMFQHQSFLLILHFVECCTVLLDSSPVCTFFFTVSYWKNEQLSVAPLDGLNTELSHWMGQTLTQVSTLIFIKVLLWFRFTLIDYLTLTVTSQVTRTPHNKITTLTLWSKLLVTKKNKY